MILTRSERQREGIKKWIAADCTASLVYATGFGKTRTALMAIALVLKHNPNANILVSVPTKYLKDQWLEKIEEQGFTDNVEVIVVNTIIKHSYDVDLLILDEAHRHASIQLSNIFNCVKYKMILCLTATMKRLDGREAIIETHAPICDEITMDEAIKNGWISPVKNYLVLLEVDLTKYKELDRTFNSYFSYFNWDFNTAINCLQNWKFRNQYAKQIGSDPKSVLRLSAQWMKALQARKHFIESHPKKIEVCQKIVDARLQSKGLMFCPTIKFAEAVKRGTVLHSQQKAKENAKVIEEFNNAQSGWLSTSKMLDEGADIQGLTVGIKMNVNSSKIKSTQQQGRICRFSPGKEAEMFTLVIKGTQEVKWFNNSTLSNYIVIDSEEKLNKVLNGEEIVLREHTPNEDLQFRF